MIYRFFATKDTFITNVVQRTLAQTGSNLGTSEILELFRIAPTSSLGIQQTTPSGSLARILVAFDTTQFASLTASNQAPASGASFFLRMKNAQHARTLPSSYDVMVERVSQVWDEGRGTDSDTFADPGFANWVNAQQTSSWAVAGASATGSMYAVQHFDVGNEDLLVDVTNQVNSWLTGSIPNNGFLVHLSSTLETATVDYYVKMFHSRESHYPDAVPYLEARWDDSIKDDRANFVFGVTCSLYLYNEVRGAFANIPAVPTGTNAMLVQIRDSGSNLITTVTASWTGFAGIYSASFAIASSSNFTGSVFTDIWYSGSAAYMTGAFPVGSSAATQVSRPVSYLAKVTNLRSQYELAETPKLSLFIQPRNFAPAVVLTASATPLGTIITKGYYRVVNDRTNEVVIPFGTGSPETTRLSYDANGNFFSVPMAFLPSKQVYRISFLFDVDGQRQVIEDGFKFRLLDNL